MQKNYNENLVAGAAIRDDKGRRISKLFESPHPKMTVGYAKNLIMPNDPTEQEFNFRQAGGGVIENGVAVIDKVKGNSVVWNQLVNYIAPKINGDTANLTCTREADGRYKIVLSAQVTELSNIIFAPTVSTGVRAGHKYISKYGESDNLAPHIGYSNGNGVWWQWTPSGLATLDSIVTSRETTDLYGTFYVGTTLPAGTYYILPTLIDLTQMFGAGNEPTTYEEFLSRKPKVEDEYAYNGGEIINNKMEKVVTTGRNLFDSSTAIDGKTIYDDNGVETNNSLGWCSTFIPIIGGESYFCKGVRIDVQAYGVHYYDKDKQHINGITIPQNGRTFDAPINAKYIRIHGLYDSSPTNAAILNLSDASFNGQYTPYEEHTLDLSWVKDIKDADGVKLFENGMKSAGTAFDEVQAKKLVKRIEVVDLGELEWKTNTAPTEENERMCRFFVRPTGLALKPNFSNCVLSPKFGYANDLKINASYNHTCFSYADGRVFFNIALSEVGEYSIDAIRNYMQGVPLYYELAEPIEVEYDEKNLTYPVVAGGTEEAIASEPSTAFRADIGYGIDAVKTILDLKARVEALEGK